MTDNASSSVSTPAASAAVPASPLNAQEELRRRTARVATNFTVDICGQTATGQNYKYAAVSTVVSPGGATFVLDCEACDLEGLRAGQRVSVETSFGTVKAEINGLWTEPKNPAGAEAVRFFIGLRLSEGHTWMM